MTEERYSEAETKKVAEKLLSLFSTKASGAIVVGLSGDLGAGKTTLVKALGGLLGVEETIQSPTFVIAKFYPTQHEKFSQLVHVDAYRIDDPAELDVLGWDRILVQPSTLIVVEWPERIHRALPKETMIFKLEHEGDKRVLRHA